MQAESGIPINGAAAHLAAEPDGSAFIDVTRAEIETMTDLAHWRMRKLHLTGSPFATPEEVVRWLGAVQSQDYGPAKWSVAQRTAAVADAAMDQAFADGAILRTHVLRPTWHFVLPEDIRWMLELTAPRIQALNAYSYRQAELDDTVLAQCNGLLVAALQGGYQLTRKEIQVRFEQAGVTTNGLRLGCILMNAELSGIICSGALHGKQHTYALLDERASQARRLTRDEALAELTRRYFISHGPATVKDFRWWSSLSTADIKKGLELVADELEHTVIDGRSYWFAVPAADPTPTSPSIHLLQGYDEYVVGYSESKYLLDRSGNARSLTRDRVVFNQLVILDSQVAGHWKRTLRKGSVIVEVALYQAFGDAQTRALQAAADQHAEFLGLPASVVVLSPVMSNNS